ncbi:VIT family-domain-containing protein [Sordaria brevicollis]|uniref:VIT family-domain-containing protein n=1 Tax=Sordaria brevicollis TaxID=83679 RepID=A0AAE0NVR0_SORBR|nr:VIT family-domain-containing protein [Sordaria brevicollis]
MVPSPETSPLLGPRPSTTDQQPISEYEPRRSRPSSIRSMRSSLTSSSVTAAAIGPIPSQQPCSDTASSSSSPSKKITFSDLFRDIILGFSDGLTVPFALTAGLSTLGSTKLVIMGGLAELFSGMISMGLGAYLAGVTERQHWEAEHSRKSWEVAKEQSEILAILEDDYGVSRSVAAALVGDLSRKGNEENLVRFLMDLQLRMMEPDLNRAWVSAGVMGLSYFVGGLIPMLPYFFMERAGEALWVSVVITAVILLVFGFVKNWVTIRTRRAGVWGAVQTLVIGALAAGTSWVIVRGLDSEH